ncbi:MAG: biotin/lipoyl-binding protein [Acidimicrobiia bacterium]|nr:biotin/lipoyl-binding protein [Acidimicrobiia bacterium]
MTVGGRHLRLARLSATHDAMAAESIGTGTLTSQMPGTVVEVRVSEGQPVRAGEVLLLVAAMKMEYQIRAPADGTISALHVVSGDTIEAGASLIDVQPDETEE